MQKNMKIAILLALVNYLGAIWPVTCLVNLIQPFILGLPFFLFSTALWLFVCFLNLAICYHLIEGKREGKQ